MHCPLKHVEPFVIKHILIYITITQSNEKFSGLSTSLSIHAKSVLKITFISKCNLNSNNKKIA